MSFFVSLLGLEETAFVLVKLKTDSATIDKMVDRLLPYADVSYDRADFLQARELARNVSFQNMSDYLHTAIAETHCTELYTFNKADFKRIQRHTRLKINSIINGGSSPAPSVLAFLHGIMLAY